MRSQFLKKVFQFIVFASLLGCCCLTGCATDLIGDPCDLSKVESPTGIAIHPNGRYAYITGSNFDLDYRATDGGAIYVVDLQTNTVLPSSKRMGSFGTNIVLSSDARHGFTVTRDDDALVWFEISEDGSSISCPEAGSDSNSLRKCRVILDDDPTHLAITRSYRESKIIDDSGQEFTTRIEFDLLMVAQLRNARVTAITVQDAGNGKLDFSHETASFVYSASEVAWLGGERFAITGRAASNLVVVSPAIDEKGHVKGLYSSQGIVVPTGSGVYQGRGMATDPIRSQLFMLNQYPKSLLKFDISGLAKNDAASDKAQMTQMMMLPSDILKLIWVGGQDDGLLYLTSVVDDAIYIVDPRQMEIINIVDVGDGPYDLVVHEQNLYIVNFLGESISLFDISDIRNPVKVKELFSAADAAAAQ
jgi:DNA-binding beta-propeller fold protein YncE